jgi:hypothetical protein
MEIKEPVKIHNAFFSGTVPNRIEIDFTFQDFWAYFAYSTYGQQKYASALYQATSRQRQEIKNSILEEVRTATEEEKKWFEEAEEKYGVQVLLYAIDIMADSDWFDARDVNEEVPNLKSLSGFVHEGRIHLGTILRDYVTFETE